MKIIIAPSKTQDTSLKEQVEGIKIIDKEKTDALFTLIKSFSKSELMSLMKIKNKLLDETYALFQKWPQGLVYKQAIEMYRGIVFKELGVLSYTRSQVQYMNKHVIILSAMYGILKPHSLIYPYRLDMTMKPNNMNLYNYWQETIDSCFEDEPIINLASREFSQMVQKQKGHMIAIDFKDRGDKGNLKTVSIYAKKARGKMLDMMIKEEVDDFRKIKSFVIDGYCFNKDKSNDHHYIFVR